MINDFADRHYDPQVARTQERPLASGRVAPLEALMLFSLLAVLAFALVLTLKPLAILWSLPAIAISAVYPFMKRVTHLPQLVLGIAFSMGVPMAFAAQTGSVPPVAWLIVAANLSWVVAYDTMYAMVDRDDDMKAGIKSSAILFGRYDRLIISALQVLTILLLAVLGWNLRLDGYYYGALALAIGFGVYQQILLRDGEPTAYFRAFLNNAWFGAIVFLGLALAYL